jgi:cation diffusion facilitator CzcD-associated flavoprotein CzcO
MTAAKAQSAGHIGGAGHTGGVTPDYDVIVIGAGVGGIYQIKRLTDLGFAATLLEAAPDLGGTWYHNRYPGCRFDSESYTYGYSFSKELLDEWRWIERFSPQPENLRYLNFVADKFDLRRHMQFGCNVDRATFDQSNDVWRIGISGGRELTCRFLVTALGPLSVPTLPRLEGIEDFAGQSWHTARWPHEPVALAGKKVAVIGTGATGIQVIAEIADKVSHLTVFQRRPNWSAPLNNNAIPDDEMVAIRSRYDDIFAACAASPAGFEHSPDPRSFYEVTPEERIATWDRLYAGRGFGIWLGNFREIFTDEPANAEFSAYIADRMRRRVNDPAIAEKLIPRDHGFGVQRLPMETRYLEAYNRDNVELVQLSETPIERVTPTGIRTSERHHDFDVIIYATGFDAFTGGYDRIDIRGIDGATLREKWAEGPRTYLGMMIHGFPNLLMIAGPQSGTSAGNFPRAIEINVDWCTDLLQFARANNAARADASAAAEQMWIDHVVKVQARMLNRKAKSFITGYNSNIEGREGGKIRYNIYSGGLPRFAKMIQEVKENEFADVNFTTAATPAWRANPSAAVQTANGEPTR